MDKRPIRDERLIEAIEACRPGHDDLTDPGLAFLVLDMAVSPPLAKLRQDVQRADSRLAEAFRAVPVPESLADRILERLGAEVEVASLRAVPSGGPKRQPASKHPARRSARRWLVAGAAVLALAGSILLAGLWKVQQRDELTGDRVRELANEFFRGEAGALQVGRRIEDAAPPSGYPLSPDVAKVRGIRWRTVRGFLDRQGIAYDLGPAGGPRATLYVAKVGYRVSNLPSLPPSTPALVTHNLSTSAWQSGRLLYVLVVEGGPEVYRGYLDLPTTPLACRQPGRWSAFSAKSA